METLASFLSQQREKFEKQAEDARTKLAEAEAELRAIDAYEAAKHGTKRTAPTTNRSPRGEYDQKVIDIIAQHPDGIARGEIMKALGGVKVDNVLTRLKKDGKIGSKGEGKSSKYVPA